MIKSNRLLKLLSLVFILPILFVFTACGTNGQLDQQAYCEKKDSYDISVENTEYQNVLTKNSTFMPDNYRLTIKLDGKFYGISREITINAIITRYGQVYNNAMRIMEHVLNETRVTELYTRSGNLYVNRDGSKDKYDMDMESFMDLLGDTIYNTKLFINPKTIQTKLLANSDIILISGYENSVNKKSFKVNFESLSDFGFETSTVKNPVLYLNFDALGYITSLNLNFDVKVSTSDFNFDATISEFHGDIEYPNFNDYA